MDLDIAAMVHEGIDLIPNEKPKRIGVYYPSELSYCQRKLYYSYLEKGKADLRGKLNLATGSAFHKVIQDALEAYVKKHPELKLMNEPTDIDRIYKIREDIELHGRPDSILINEKGETVVIEIKSHANFKYLKEGPEHSHIDQMNYYLRPTANMPITAEGRILYVNKMKRTRYNQDSYKEMLEFPGYHFDIGIFNLMTKKAIGLHEALLKREVPMPDGYLRGGTMDNECRFLCNYREKCYDAIMARQISAKERKAIETAIDEMSKARK